MNIFHRSHFIDLTFRKFYNFLKLNNKNMICEYLGKSASYFKQSQTDGKVKSSKFKACKFCNHEVYFSYVE